MPGWQFPKGSRLPRGVAASIPFLRRIVISGTLWPGTFAWDGQKKNLIWTILCLFCKTLSEIWSDFLHSSSLSAQGTLKLQHSAKEEITLLPCLGCFFHWHFITFPSGEPTMATGMKHIPRRSEICGQKRQILPLPLLFIPTDSSFKINVES